MEKHSASSMPAAAGAIREERKFLLRSDRLRAARILGNVERQNTSVVRAAALFHTVGQDRRDELLGIMSLPACKQVLQPFVVKRVGHAVGEHYEKAPRRELDMRRLRRGRALLQARGQARAGHAAHRAAAL